MASCCPSTITTASFFLIANVRLGQGTPVELAQFTGRLDSTQAAVIIVVIVEEGRNNVMDKVWQGQKGHRGGWLDMVLMIVVVAATLAGNAWWLGSGWLVLVQESQGCVQAADGARGEASKQGL